MENPQDSQNGNLEERVENSYSIVDENASSNVVVIPFLGANGEYLRKVAEETKQKQDTYAIVPYIDDTEGRMGILRDLNTIDNPTLQIMYLSDKLSNDKERAAYGYIEGIKNMGGIENYLSLLALQQPEINPEQALEMYNKILSEYNSLGIENKIDKIKKTNQGELETILEENAKTLEAVNLAFSEYSMNKLTDTINEINKENEEKGYGQIKIIGGGGMSDERYNIELLQQSTPKNTIHYIGNIREFTLGENGETYDLANLGIDNYIQQNGFANSFLMDKNGIKTLNTQYTNSKSEYDLDEIVKLAQKYRIMQNNAADSYLDDNSKAA